MNEEAILRARGANWRRLQELTYKAGGSFRKLTDEELEEFLRLYRQASADLAFLTTRSSNQSVVAYLNEVVGRAYSQLYREPYKPWGQRIVEALETAAQTVRRRRWALFVAIAIFFGAAFTSSALLAYSDDFRAFYVPQGGPMGDAFEAWKSGRHEERTDSANALMMVFYMSNNPFVSILTHAFSVVTFGLLSVVIVWQNGALLGALGFETAGAGTLDFMLSSIAPHGVTELGGIFMAAAGGFVLAWALINPGRKSRGEALRVAGRDAYVFALLGIAMMLLAAPIEGFFSFDPRIPGWLKLVVAGFTLFGWLAFFIGFGRKKEAAATSAP